MLFKALQALRYKITDQVNKCTLIFCLICFSHGSHKQPGKTPPNSCDLFAVKRRLVDSNLIKGDEMKAYC